MSWGIIDNLSGSGINFIVALILARHLVPERILVIDIALLILLVANIIIDGGLYNALIRKHEVQRIEYDTAFILNISIASATYLMLFVLAPAISWAYGIEELTSVIRWLGLSVILGSFSVVQKAWHTKLLDFKSQAQAALFSSCLSAAVALYMIYSNYGIWSLVTQQLIRQATYTLFIYCKSDYRPRLHYSKDAVRSLLGFGSGILGSALLDLSYRNFVLWATKRMYGARTSGLYTRAEQLTSIITVNFSAVMQKVSLPLLAANKNQEDDLAYTFRFLFNCSLFIGLFVAFTLYASADQLVAVVLGKNWMEIIPILRIFSIVSLFYPITIMHQSLLQTFGLSKLFFRIEVCKKIIFSIVIGISLYFGWIYFLWANVATALGAYLFHVYYNLRLCTTYTIGQQAIDTIKLTGSIGAIAIISYYLGTLVPLPLWSLLLQVVVISTFSITIFLLLFKKDIQHFKTYGLRADNSTNTTLEQEPADIQF